MCLFQQNTTCMHALKQITRDVIVVCYWPWAQTFMSLIKETQDPIETGTCPLLIRSQVDSFAPMASHLALT